MATSRNQHAEDQVEEPDGDKEVDTEGSRARAARKPRSSGRSGGRSRRPQLRLVGGRDVEARDRRAADQSRRKRVAGDEGTTTAEYTVVTGAAVAFGALLFKLLTSEWGTKILTTAFKHVISLLGF